MTFNSTEMRKFFYEAPCVVCRAPVTSVGSFLIRRQDHSSTTFGPFCPVHRRAPINQRETSVSVGAFVNRGIAFAASREGLAFIEDLLAPALDDALREWESKRDLQG